MIVPGMKLPDFETTACVSIEPGRESTANDLDVGRNVGEVLRVLDCLQTGELCPCNWQKGQDTLTQQMKRAR